MIAGPPASASMEISAGLAAHPETIEAQVGERMLLVRARDGIADLEAAAVLAGSGLRLWRRVRENTASFAELAALLDASAGGAAIDAECQALAWVDALRARGLLQGQDQSRASAPHARLAPSPSSTEVVEVEELEALARAVLAGGRRLRFRAHGASMLPQIPSGALLEVRPAAFAAVRRGDLVFFTLRAADELGELRTRWVAHRVVRRDEAQFWTRGDNAPRIDLVRADMFLGVVDARIAIEAGGRERRVALDGALRRARGLARGAALHVARAVLRRVVARPLRSAWIRRAVAALLRGTSRCGTVLERKLSRARRRIDVAISALTPRDAKDLERRELYASKSVRDFTALDENLVAGLTLLEEVLLARHPLPGPRVLVVGCGPGRECAALARAGFRVTGLDRDAGMLARARELTAGLDVRYVEGDAADFRLTDERFDAVLIYSGLYNMLLPRGARIALLAAARRHLAPGGVVQLTFLSDYVPPGRRHARRDPWLLRAIEPEHEEGDLFLLNETVHIFPRGEDVAVEARRAELEVVEIFRDQRGYDREARQVRGYAVLRAALVPGAPCR